MPVLAVLHAADSPLRIDEVARPAAGRRPHVTRQVNALERRGLVRRVTDPLDSERG
jgi:DNA-binding MarR family transcriptional regulator